jgi:hypothetical protein
VPSVVALGKDEVLQQQLKNNIAEFGVSDADIVIARNILSLIQENK